MSERKREEGGGAAVVEWVPKAAAGPLARADGGPAISPRAQVLVLIFGVILPAAVLVIEWSARLCAEAFFDPIPTAGHVVLVALVPLVNLWGLFQLGGKTQIPAWASRSMPVVLGVSLAVSAFYALLFLPLLPLAVVAILFYGLGLLPFGPVAGLASLLFLRSRLFRQSADANGRRRPVMAGLVLGIVALAGLDMPAAMTRLGLQWAVSPETAERERGLWVLRTLADRDELLRLAYDTGGRTGGPLSLLIGLGGEALLDPVRRTAVHSPQEVREVFYRAYGVAFNALPPPHTGRQWARFGDFAFDADHGGAEVGGRIKGLDLISSRMDASLSGDDAAGYLEWILEFRNTSGLDREARMTIALPPGGVVSRATLWVNGEEREAAYGGREEMRKAYTEVAVQQRRDPLLVTTKGADRVLAQAFPVPRGGTIKFKIGITAPLDLLAKDRAVFTMPAIFDRNFSIPEDVAHAVWIESKTALKSEAAGLKAGSAGGGGFRLEGNVADKELAQRRPQVAVARGALNDRLVARNDDGPQIQQTVREATAALHGPLVVLVDGSERVRGHAEAVATALGRIDGGASVGLIIASEPMVRIEPAAFEGAHKARVVEAVRRHSFAGGQDNTPAFAEALKLAGGDGHGRILWVHGPQPQRFAKTAGLLEQAAARIGRAPAIDLYAVEPGPNELLPDEVWASAARLVPSHGDVAADLSGYLRLTAGGGASLIIEREPVGEASAGSSAEGSSHIVRLWARDEVLRLMAQDAGQNRPRAIALAQTHRLVTPVSGAVVLETKAQFEAAGLQPVAQGSVPTVPEPHEWALIALAALLILHFAARRRAEWGGLA